MPHQFIFQMVVPDSLRATFSIRNSESSKTDILTRFYSLNMKSAVLADSGEYVCLVVNSLVEMDRTSRYQKASLLIQSSKKQTGLSLSRSDEEDSDQVNDRSLTIVAIFLGILVIMFCLVLVMISVCCREKNPRKHCSRHTPISTLNHTVVCYSAATSSAGGSFQRVSLDRTNRERKEKNPSAEKRPKLPIVEKPGDGGGSSRTLQAILIRPRVYQTPGRPILQENYAKTKHRNGNKVPSKEPFSTVKDSSKSRNKLLNEDGTGAAPPTPATSLYLNSHTKAAVRTRDGESSTLSLIHI